MGYKKLIDNQRVYKSLIEYNQSQILDELITFDDKDKFLPTEFYEYEKIKTKIDKYIKDSQPWYRKLIGRLY